MLSHVFISFDIPTEYMQVQINNQLPQSCHFKIGSLNCTFITIIHMLIALAVNMARENS